MSVSNLQLHFQVNARIELVSEALLDTEKFVAAHPLIYRMDSLGNQTYKVYEKVKMVFIPYSFAYKVSITDFRPENRIRLEATIAGMTHIVMDFMLTANGDRTNVTEDITITTRLPIHGYMQQLFRKQHDILFDNIERLA